MSRFSRFIEADLSKLHQWYHSALGQKVWQEERTVLMRILATLSGESLMQLGGPQCSDWMSSCKRIRHFFYVSPQSDLSFWGPAVQSKFDALAIAPSSVDIAVLFHVLECMEDPRTVLHETFNALHPEAYLLILTLNIHSFWGIVLRLIGVSSLLPWCRYMHSMNQIKKSLSRENAVFVKKFSLAFDFPWGSLGNVSSYLLRRMGRLCCPLSGCFQIILVKKRSEALTPICSKRYLESIVSSGGEIEPVANRSSMESQR